MLETSCDRLRKARQARDAVNGAVEQVLLNVEQPGTTQQRDSSTQ
jgi:hypothetical protein